MRYKSRHGLDAVRPFPTETLIARLPAEAFAITVVQQGPKRFRVAHVAGHFEIYELGSAHGHGPGAPDREPLHPASPPDPTPPHRASPPHAEDDAVLLPGYGDSAGDDGAAIPGEEVLHRPADRVVSDANASMPTRLKALSALLRQRYEQNNP
jgi:hypothetical protein